MKRNIIELSVIFAFLITVIISLCSFESSCQQISSQVLRLHVIANSDSKEDQELKLRVRDKILERSNDILKDANEKSTAQRKIADSLNELRLAAEDEIRKSGYTYPVRLELAKTDFPTRTYGNVTLPAGQYNAVRVIIGSGEGKNWWCVMFPPLCLSAAKKQTELSDVLNKEELELTE
ncbi:MAG: stage II sporulation protein R, partial [Acutalibacteraceae bacterium]